MDTKALRQKILDLAIRGKLVPQDPNDEPASVLLERIRAEKQQMVKDGKLKPKDIKNDTVIFKGDDNLHYEKFSDGTVKCIEDEIPFELPEGWTWCRVQTIASVKGGKRVPKGYAVTDEKTNHIYIRVTDMKNSTIMLDDLKYISDEVYSQISNYVISKDDIYVTIAGTIGNVGEVPDELDGMNLTENAAKVCNISIDKSFLCKVLSSEFVQKQFRFQTHQVTMAKLALEHILDTLIPIAPIDEQTKISRIIDDLSAKIYEIQNSNNNLQALISATKFKILDLAIRGKLVPQDPNDEPASVLLERIRAEKEELIKQGKIKRDKKESVIFKGDDNSYYEKYGEKLPSGWVVTNFETLLSYEQPTNYIVKDTNYNSDYETPVLTAGKSFILGYTDEKENVFSKLPVIIFDDFTTESKFVDFPFKVKSSAMKILHINTDIVLPKFAFYLMQATEIDHDNHQRYWISTYSQEEIALPPLKEQERILSALKQYFKLLNCLL